MSIFQTPPNGSPINILYFCAQNWAASTVFRQLQVATSTTSTSLSSSTSTTLVTTTTPAAAQGGTTAAAPAGQNTNTGAATSSSGSSMAWIAGTAVGAVIGFALIGSLVWWIIRHRAKKPSAAAAATSAGMAGAGGHKGPYNDSAYHDNPQMLHSRPVSSVPPYQHESQNKAALRPVSTATYASGPGPPSPLPPSVAGSGGYGGAPPQQPPPQELSNIPGTTDHQGVVYEMHENSK
ncbi:hypothetical protein PG993_008895 [Apiospora rasikravindrae]|uniref:Uncharacterized protein n=1 Tax=Apiospora rasikravindrae TaxID=990691 RepID=A0ABR1SPL9_9PEZI